MSMDIDANRVINELVAEVGAKVREIAILRAQIGQMQEMTAVEALDHAFGEHEHALSVVKED
jgi:hypothetical protein